MPYSAGTPGQDRILVILTSQKISLIPPDVSYNNTYFNLVGSVSITQMGFDASVFGFFLLESDLPGSGGNYDIKVSGSGIGKSVGIFTFQQALQINPLVVTDSDPYSTNYVSNNIEPYGKCLIIDALSVRKANYANPNSGQSAPFNSNQQNILTVMSYKNAIVPTSMSWNIDPRGDGWAHLIMAIHDISVSPPGIGVQPINVPFITNTF